MCDEEEATPELTAALRRLVVQHEVHLVTVGDIDPVAVPVPAPAARDVDADRALPTWLRGDARLMEELRVSRLDARTSFHTRVAALGVVHEHVAEATTALTAVLRLLARNRHARGR